MPIETYDTEVEDAARELMSKRPSSPEDRKRFADIVLKSAMKTARYIIKRSKKNIDKL